MRRMVDSTNVQDDPLGVEIVMYYCDGDFAVDEATVRARFPNATLVPCSAIGTNSGKVGDVEPGCMTILQSIAWVIRRRGAGEDPTLYVNELYGWGPLREAFQVAGVPEPHYGVADYDGIPVVPPGAVFKQYENPTLTGGHFDLSVVADFWPGVDSSVPNIQRKPRRRKSVATSDNHNVFIKGTDTALWHNRYDVVAAKWVGWQSLGGQLGDEEIEVTGFGQRLDVYIIGTDQAVYHCYSPDAGRSWSSLLSDDLGGKEAAGSLVAVGPGPAPAAPAGGVDLTPVLSAVGDLKTAMANLKIVGGGLTPEQDAHLADAEAASAQIEAQLKAGLKLDIPLGSIDVKGTVGA